MAVEPVYIDRITAEDQQAITEFTIAQWGALIVVSHGTIYRPAELAGFIARQGEEIVGVITYVLNDEQCEIVTLNSLQEGIGIGTSLIQAVKQLCIDANCSRLWLITSNNNLNALKFYQKRGFRLVAVHHNAIDEARKLKPGIPLVDDDGIPLHDELELELLLE